MEATETAICLMVKAVVLSARWTARRRQLCLEQAAEAAGDLAQLRTENLMLRDRLELQAEQIAHLRRPLRQANVRLPYSSAERLRLLCSMEYFSVPRRRGMGSGPDDAGAFLLTGSASGLAGRHRG